MNGWQRIGVIISIAWCLYPVGLLAYTYTHAESFDDATKGSCSSLSMPFISWHDTKGNQEISIYRPGEKGLFCETIDSRLSTLREIYFSGKINPVLKIQYLSLAAATLIPIILFWAGSFFLVWLVQWVLSGFRKSKTENNLKEK